MIVKYLLIVSVVTGSAWIKQGYGGVSVSKHDSKVECMEAKALVEENVSRELKSNIIATCKPLEATRKDK